MYTISQNAAPLGMQRACARGHPDVGRTDLCIPSRRMLLHLVCSVPVLEDTLMWVLLMGLASDLPVTAADSLELADQLICRAAMQQDSGERRSQSEDSIDIGHLQEWCIVVLIMLRFISKERMSVTIP